MSMSRIFGALLLVGLSLGLGGELWAHGEGVLRADRSSMEPGGSLKLEGTQMEKGETYRLKLVGALQEFELGSATADAKGAFTQSVQIPAGAREGSYRLQAIAPDGDVGASLEVTVLAAAPVPSEASTEPAARMGDMAAHGPMTMAAETPIVRQQGSVASLVIGLLIGLAAGFGAGLLLQRRVAYREA